MSARPKSAKTRFAKLRKTAAKKSSNKNKSTKAPSTMPDNRRRRPRVFVTTNTQRPRYQFNPRVGNVYRRLITKSGVAQKPAITVMNTAYDYWQAQILASTANYALHYQLPGLPYTGVANYNNLQTTVDFNTTTVPVPTSFYSRLEGDAIGIGRYGTYNGLVNTSLNVQGNRDVWILFDFMDWACPIKIFSSSDTTSGPATQFPWITSHVPSPNYDGRVWTNTPYTILAAGNQASITETYGDTSKETDLRTDTGMLAYCGGGILSVEITNQTAYTAVAMRAVSDPDMIQRFVETIDFDDFGTTGDIGLFSQFQPAKTAIVQNVGTKWYAPVAGPATGLAPLFLTEAYAQNRLFDAIRNGFPLIQLTVTNQGNTTGPAAGTVNFSLVAQCWLGIAPTLRSRAGAQPYATTSLAIPNWVRGYRNIGTVGRDPNQVNARVTAMRIGEAVTYQSPSKGPQTQFANQVSTVPTPVLSQADQPIAKPGLGNQIISAFGGLAGDLAPKILRSGLDMALRTINVNRTIPRLISAPPIAVD